MIGDPALTGIGAVIFDEFHEHYIFGDITLAQAVYMQRTSRPDLLIVVMSAVLDPGPLQRYLAPCRLVRTEGRKYPVGISYSAHAAKVAQSPV